MVSMKTWMLSAAVLAGTLGLGANTAQAARVGVYIGGPVAYVPPCPGPGYEWAAGYYANGYWVPGRWNFVGVRGGVVVDRGFAYRGRDFDRRFDDRHFDRDHDRGGHFRR